DELPRWKSDMLLHFSRNIAGEMTAVDGSHNGWRCLILPFARRDSLVLNAVLTVSAFHICLNRLPATGISSRCVVPRTNFQIPDPNQLYRQVISGLQQQPDLESCDADRKHSILLTILVLLVGVMVTGRSDFPMLFRMLESALAAIGGGEALGDGEVANFILPQISNASFAFITDLVQQAINMYLEQVVRNSSLSPSNTPTALEIADSITRVEHFKETLEAFPPGAPGEQVIIWASFVAAASCLLDEHMQFFEEVFMRHYLRSGFANLITGLEVLRKIWARKPDERWTLLLAGIKILVM
ncbi:hypothetical protein FALBO_9349, partial [Fusarium albosuccineum]